MRQFYRFEQIREMIEEKTLSPSLRLEINEYEKKYLQLSQMAYYRNLQQIEKLQVFTKSSWDVSSNITFCYDSRNFESDLKNLIELYVLRTLNEQVPKLKNKFSIVYIHNNIKDFIFFRNIIRILPEQFLIKLETIYLVQVGIIVKIIEKLSFGAFNNFFEEKIQYSERLQDIQNKHKTTLGGGVTKSKLKMRQPEREQEININNLVPSTEVIKNGFYGKQLYEYEEGKYGLPTILQLLIGRLYSQTYFLQKEGIMRKSCDVEELEILQNHILKGQGIQQYVMNEKDPYVLGGCVKKIFNNLQTPLFTYTIYEEIISYRSDGILQNDLQFVRKCMKKMDEINRKVLAYFAGFLVKGIIFHYEANKMNAYNLAVVFGPCFFRPKQYKLQDLMNSGRFSFIIKIIFDHYEEVFGAELAYKNFHILEKQKEQINSKKW